jgi:hypothetical protein
MTAIDEALRDPALLGAALGDWRSWTTWLAVLRAAFGLSLDAQQRQAFAQVAGDRSLPTRSVRELWAIVGRRAGKSRMAAAIAVYLACFIKHRLAAGERGMVLVLAATTEQARVVFDYARAFLEESPILQQEILSCTRSEIRLRNGIVIAIHSNSFRHIRGRTLCACVFDEVAVWRDESSASRDIEVFRSVKPMLSTTKGMLVGISTGYRRVGLLYQKHRDHFGQDSADRLVVQGGLLWCRLADGKNRRRGGGSADRYAGCRQRRRQHHNAEWPVTGRTVFGADPARLWRRFVQRFSSVYWSSRLADQHATARGIPMMALPHRISPPIPSQVFQAS